MSDGWKYIAASVIGTSHTKSPDGVCQDSHLCEYFEATERLVCAVCDGAGSASQALVGSQNACDVVRRLVSDAPSEEIHTREFALKVLSEIKSTIADIASVESFVSRDYACTLLAAIVCNGKTTFWQIGDGAICFRYSGDEKYVYAFWPDKGEYANTTYFVTDTNAEAELEVDNVDSEVEDLALFSDGLERLILNFQTQEVHGKFFSGLFPHLYVAQSGRAIDLESRLRAFLDSERVNDKTDDDKTLILATTREA